MNAIQLCFFIITTINLGLIIYILITRENSSKLVKCYINEELARIESNHELEHEHIDDIIEAVSDYLECEIKERRPSTKYDMFFRRKLRGKLFLKKKEYKRTALEEARKWKDEIEKIEKKKDEPHDISVIIVGAIINDYEKAIRELQEQIDDK